MRAQYFVVFANDDFGEAVCFAAGDGFAVSGPGETLDVCLGIFLPGFSFCQSDKGDFGEGIDGVWYYTIVHDCRVADGIDAGEVCLHLFVDTYAPPVVIKALLHQALEAGGVGATTDGDQHVLGGEALLPFFCTGDDFLQVAFVSEGLNCSSCDDVGAASAEGTNE